MYILNYIKTIYFNFRYLPFKQAIYLPIWITTNFKVMKLKRGQIVLDAPLRKNFFFGDCGSRGLQEQEGGICLDDGAKLFMKAMCVIAQGTVLRCDKNATIELGKNFYCNKNCYLRSSERIKFGNGCSLGWNVQINSNDGHVVEYNGEKSRLSGEITIGDHVWLTSNTIVTKDVNIADGCIVAQGAVVVKSITEPKCLVGGVPARIVKNNVEWKQ